MSIPGTQPQGPIQTFTFNGEPTTVTLPSNAIGATIQNAGPGQLIVSSNGSVIAEIGVGSQSFAALGTLSCSASTQATFTVVPLVPSLTVSSLKPVAHRVLNYGIQQSNQYATTGLTAPLQRTAYWAPQGISEIQLVWSGIILQQSGPDAPIGFSQTVTNAVEYPAGTFYPITYNNGNPTGTVTAGADEVFSDVKTLKIPASAQFWLRTWYASLTSGGNLCSNDLAMGMNDPLGNPIANEGLLNNATSVSEAVPNSLSSIFEPVALIGKPLGPSVPSIIAIGDSIMHGTNDQFVKNSNYSASAPCTGWIADLCFNRVPLVQMSLAGFFAQTYYTNFHRDSVSKHADIFLWELGINDYQTATLAQLQTWASDAWLRAKSKGLTVIATTLQPSVGLSPHFYPLITGLGGTQTPESAANYAKRIAYNNWVKSGPPNLDAAIDLCAVIDPNDSGLWPVVSPIYTGTASSVVLSGDSRSATVTDTGLSAFATDTLVNPADGLGAYMVVFTSGPNAGNGYPIFSNTGGTLVVNGTNGQYGNFNGTTFPNALLTASTNNTYVIAEPWSYDGLHPNPRTIQRIKQAAGQLLGPILGVSF